MPRKTKLITRSIAALLPIVILAGCPAEREPETTIRLFRPMNEKPPKVAYCNDHTAHVAGSKPFVLGGTCCCTPTQRVVDAYHRDGLLLKYDLGRLKAVYRGLTITTTDDHRDCNNRCAWGPHILQGGKCMVPPTPGTQHFEELITGKFSLPEKVSEAQ